MIKLLFIEVTRVEKKNTANKKTKQKYKKGNLDLKSFRENVEGNPSYERSSSVLVGYFSEINLRKEK